MFISHARERIQQIIRSTTIEMVETIGHFSLTTSEFKNINDTEITFVLIEIFGTINAKILYIFTDKMKHKIVYEMSHHQKKSREEFEDYFKEFMNIITGCTASKIKDELFERNTAILNYKITLYYACNEENSLNSYNEAYSFTGDYGSVNVLCNFYLQEEVT